MVHDEPAPVVYIDEISDGCISFQMRFYHADSERIQARDQVAETILSVLDANGVPMPTPTVHIEPTIGQVRRDDLSRKVQPEPPSPE